MLPSKLKRMIGHKPSRSKGCARSAMDVILSQRSSGRAVSFDKLNKFTKRRNSARSETANREHLKKTLDVLKTFRYQHNEKKPWLDDEGNVIWSKCRCLGLAAT